MRRGWHLCSFPVAGTSGMDAKKAHLSVETSIANQTARVGF